MSPVSENLRKAASPSVGPARARGRKLKWVGAFLALLALLALSVIVYGFLIEPYWIEVTHYDVQGAVATPLKIAHLTDLHTHGLGPRERHMLRILDQEKPDIILIVGDTVATRAGNYRQCKEVYDQLHAPLGVWFVHGNWENSKPFRAEHAYYQEAGVHFLLNSNAAARPDVWLIGLDDAYSGAAKPDAALAGVPASTYTIALFHSPAFFDRMAGRVNLCLAGHTHGGQVRLPFVKPFWLPKGCGRFVEGWYEEQGTQMYVSRGLGTSILPVRFLCRPEIAFITIHP